MIVITDIIKDLYALAIQHGVMIKLSVTPCCGSAFVSIEVAKNFINEDDIIYSEFIINECATDKEYETIRDTFIQMLEDA